MLLLVSEGACCKYGGHDVKGRVSLGLDTPELLDRKERTALHAYRPSIVPGAVSVSGLEA
jgi:hypothetical protein